MKRAALIALILGCGSQQQHGIDPPLVTTQDQICRQAAAVGASLIGQWTIKIGGLCEGSMSIVDDDPIPSGIYGCANNPTGAPTYAGTVRIGPAASGANLYFTSQGFMEGQLMRGTLSADGHTLTGAFNGNGDGPAPGMVFTATR